MHLAFFADYSGLGGYELDTLNLAGEFANRGFRTTVITLENAGSRRFADSIAREHRVVVAREEKGKDLIRELAKDPPDAFINAELVEFFPEISCRLRRPLIWRLISHPRFWRRFCRRYALETEDMARRVGLFSDRIIAVSDFVKDSFARLGLRRVETIYNGCDPDLFRPDPSSRARFRAEFGLGAEELALGIVANIREEKRHEDAIRALARLPASSPPWRCFMAGGTWNPDMRDLERRLKRLAGSLGLARRVRFIGFRTDIAGALNGLDILLFPFFEEGCSNALLQGMACAKPVLVLNSGSFPEIVRHGREGLIAPAEDPAAFANGLERLLRDPALRLALGGRGRERIIRRFSLKRQMDAYERAVLSAGGSYRRAAA